MDPLLPVSCSACRFCTKPTVTRGGKVPSILYGPQLNITISPGNCSLAKDASLGGKNITCFGPSVSYSKVRTHWGSWWL